MRVTPILAAIMIDPERAEEMVLSGAPVNYVRNSYASPLYCAAFRNSCRAAFGLPPYNDSYDSVRLMSLLLEKGADPESRLPKYAGEWHGIESYLEKYLVMKRPFPEALFCYYDNYRDENVRLHRIGGDHIKKINLLVDKGLDFNEETDLSSCQAAARKVTGGKGRVSEADHSNAELSLAIMSDIEKNGGEALARWENPKEAFVRNKEKERKAEEERKRLAAIAREKRRQKMAAIRGYFKQDSDLSSALGDVVQSGAYCQTISSMSSTIRSGDGEARCSTTVGGSYFSSPNCEAYREQLSRHVADEKRPLCDAYKKQKSSLAGLFGKNADIVKSLIEQDVSNARLIEEIERVYQPEINRLARLRDKDAASERRAMDQASRQRMNNLMNYMQDSFTSTTKADQIIQRSVQNIQQQLYVRANNQKMHEINVNLKDLDKKLDSIERQVSEKASNPGKSSANAGASPSIRVCAGPFTVPAMNQVFSIAEQNSGKTDVDYQCPAGSSPVLEGRYSIDGQYGNYVNGFMRPPSYKKEVVRDENGSPYGHRYSWDAYRYECLCGTGSETKAGGYQQ